MQIADNSKLLNFKFSDLSRIVIIILAILVSLVVIIILAILVSIVVITILAILVSLMLILIGAVSLLTQLANTFIHSTLPDLRYLPIIVIINYLFIIIPTINQL